MSTATVVVAIVAIVIIGLLLALAMRGRAGGGVRLRDLPDASRQRYAEQWRNIEARFVEDPQAALREADALCLSMLRERGHPNDASRMPSDLREARAAYGPDGGNTDTEAMRRSMLRYRAIVDDAVGTRTRESMTRGREIAS
jgi:hypothetical protein